MRGAEHGFTLVEVVIALFLIAVGVVALAPLFVFAAQENAVGRDMGTIGAEAVHRLEQLRATSWFDLENGGGLDANVSDYFQIVDAGNVVRWLIEDGPDPPGNTRRITVRAIARGATIGQPKDVTIVTVRAF